MKQTDLVNKYGGKEPISNQPGAPVSDTAPELWLDRNICFPVKCWLLSPAQAYLTSVLVYSVLQKHWKYIFLQK